MIGMELLADSLVEEGWSPLYTDYTRLSLVSQCELTVLNLGGIEEVRFPRSG